MPAFVWSRALAINQLGDNPLVGWQYEYVPESWIRGAVVELLQRATTANVRTTVYSGSQTIQQRSPVQAGGTSGVTPSPLNTPPASWVAQPGDRLLILNDEVAGIVATVDGIINLEPV